MNNNQKLQITLKFLLMIQIPVNLNATEIPELNDSQYSGNDLYDEIMTRSRSSRDFTNNGTVIYNYNEISNECNDKCLAEENLGNIVLDRSSRVKEIYNRIIVDEGIQSHGEDINIGNITIDKNSSVRNIQNKVKIEGDITSHRDEMHIGDVNIDRGGDVDKLQSTITIEGDIDAE